MNTTASPDHSEHELCNLLTELIRIDTSNPPGRNYPTCVRFLEQQLQRLGFQTRIHQVPPELLRSTVPDCETFPRHILVGRWNVGASETVHFNAHYDVVPAGGGWTTPPFEPAIREGWIYGRGANDMKGSIAALLHAFASLRRRNELPRMNVEVAFVPDEETNSLLGTGYLVEQKLVRADYAVVCEGGRDNVIGCGHNGVLWLDVTVKGKSAHAARPHLGINAFEKAAALVTALETYKSARQQQVFTAPGGARFAPTLTLGGEAATGPGGKVNVIPEQFTFTLDRRVLPNEDLDEVERDLRGFLLDCTRRIPDLALEIRTRSSRRSSLLSETHLLPQTFLAAAKPHRPGIGFGITSGFTDMSFYANEAGMPTIGYGVSGKNTHGVDECVGIEDLMTVSRIYADFLTFSPQA